MRVTVFTVPGKNRMKSPVTKFCLVMLFVVGLFSGNVLAAKESANNGISDKDMTAHQVVQKTTDRVMKIIVEAQGYFDQDPQRFYREIEKVLSDVVDFDSFARGVMGRYASKQMYMSLESEAEKDAFRARMDRFSSTFKDGLVQTYAKGLLAFNGNKIDVLPPSGEVNEEESVTVIQHIHGDAEKPYVVQYKMRKNREGEWKLRNVTIEAINLGRVYQSQFSSAARQYNGDIDKVIENWSVTPGDESEESAG